MDHPSSSWRELFRSDDLAAARSVLTSIAAMEFDARLVAQPPRDEEELEADDDHPGDPPYVIEVRDGDWEDLAGVLDQVVDEQSEFDEKLDRRGQRFKRLERGFIILAAAVILILVALRMIQL